MVAVWLVAPQHDHTIKIKKYILFRFRVKKRYLILREKRKEKKSNIKEKKREKRIVKS